MYKLISTETNITTKRTVNDFAQLSNYFEEVQKHLSKKGKFLLLCIDEYERFDKSILSGKLEGLPDAFRYWIQHLDNFIFLFAGSHEISEISVINWSDYLINLRTVKISYLDPKSALRLLTQPIPKFDLKYEPETLPEAFAKLLGGMPYLSQAAMFELVQILNNDDSRKTATQVDIDEAVKRMFVATQSYFNDFWNEEISEDMRQILIGIIKDNKNVFENKRALNLLLQKDIIYKTENGYEFLVPVVRMWIEQNVL